MALSKLGQLDLKVAWHDLSLPSSDNIMLAFPIRDIKALITDN
ncbi:hypothetical protein BGS_1027 [Beggiatoa sp. SS]|nr:hypothetical protein BGS_1027 [Beggiatoa sp. SS]